MKIKKECDAWVCDICGKEQSILATTDVNTCAICRKDVCVTHSYLIDVANELTKALNQGMPDISKFPIYVCKSHIDELISEDKE